MIEVEILSPSTVCWIGKAKFMSFRTVDGSMGILPKRAPIVAQLAIDYVRVVTESEEKTFATYGGYIHCDGQKVTVVSSIVVPVEDLDPHVFKNAQERAKKLLEYQDQLYRNTKIEADVRAGK
ncbi:ATP synthase F1 subunit epsilon [Pseudothermotoga lettingae]|jgi:F-type H+-transporting ATPase subunit epsilon|uniref:ATP synthase epsilon chain n=1 Tax=Pseudothermotoga lettingae (strain ATCC BAA-301 / DSM 14385 / NBRC 107922 / TMO) TaxID=416591 RepID=A8F3K3_PSELT|nr:ATP synthase F1 subunit epsilon [Pseudothermotoga lettingae]MDI3495594.1 F-type H+-transporting ATPase subunit epsilon [Pseudothermotoga sp.]ABV32737.1 ATP synthase F1, epsilon subunit [Pseudothermotoga lettingae TMO]KUK20639.1 MAG: ATP synthase epsilon chain [Pseudothermotoga lettingae]GLI48270.1 ATP synthase epsilon chain [Pseudothermotoga lettingae TMO]HBT25348.1 F0F1 ATP synthase subunit epsilon [Pseudothermotoga sp.]